MSGILILGGIGAGVAVFNGYFAPLINRIGSFFGMAPNRELSKELTARVGSVFTNTFPIIDTFIKSPVKYGIFGSVTIIGGWLTLKKYPSTRQSFSQATVVALKTFAVYTVINNWCSLFYPDSSEHAEGLTPQEQLQAEQHVLLMIQTISLLSRVCLSLYSEWAVRNEAPPVGPLVEYINDYVPPMLIAVRYIPAISYVHEFGHLFAIHSLFKAGGERIVVDPIRGSAMWRKVELRDLTTHCINPDQPLTAFGKVFGSKGSEAVYVIAGPALQFAVTIFVFKRALQVEALEPKKIVLGISLLSLDGLVRYTYSPSLSHDFRWFENLSGIPPIVLRVIIVAAPTFLYARHSTLKKAVFIASAYTATNFLLHGSL